VGSEKSRYPTRRRNKRKKKNELEALIKEGVQSANGHLLRSGNLGIKKF
jgi:hypothetical protein